MKTVKARKKVKIFLESVMKTVFYVKRAPLDSNVGSLTLPLPYYFLLLGRVVACKFLEFEMAQNGLFAMTHLSSRF